MSALPARRDLSSAITLPMSFTPAAPDSATVIDNRGEEPVFTDGPFVESKEFLAGFWILEVSSREEVLEWVRKAPFRDGEVEVRQVASAEDFGDAMTPELREQEDRLRATAAAQRES